MQLRLVSGKEPNESLFWQIKEPLMCHTSCVLQQLDECAQVQDGFVE